MRHLLFLLSLIALSSFAETSRYVDAPELQTKDRAAININFQNFDNETNKIKKNLFDVNKRNLRNEVNIVPQKDSSSFTVFDVDGKILETSDISKITSASQNSYVGSSTISVTDITNISTGMAVYDQNAPLAIPPGATISGINGNIITLTSVLVSTHVYSGDVLKFISNPTWFTDTVTHAVQHGYPLVVNGQGGKNNDTVGPTQLIVTNGPINIPASIFQFIDFSQVQIEIIGTDGFVFDSAEYMDFRGPIITTYHGNGSMYKWLPQNQTPVDHLVGFSGNRFDFGALAFQGGNGSTGRIFDFYPANGTISENRFIFREIFGGKRSLEGGGYLETPILVNNAGASTYFRFNIFDGNHLHGFTTYGFSEGTSATNQTNINNNQWRIGKIAPALNSTGAVGFRTYGSYETIISAISNDEMGTNFSNPFALQSGANYNKIFVNHSGATSGYIDNGTLNLCHSNGAFEFISAGANPAVGTQIGIDNDAWISAKNAASSGNVAIIKVDSSDLISFGQNRTAATVPGNFTASYWIQFHDASGNNFYVPANGTSW